MSLELDIDSGKADRSLANTLALVNSLGESLTKLGSMNKAGLRSVQQEIQNLGKQSSLDSIRRIASLMNLSLDDMIKSAKGKVPAKEIDRINKELNASFITMKTILSDAGNVVSAEAMKMVSKMDAPVDHAVKRVKAATSTMTDGVASATEASGRRAKTIAQKYSEDMTKAYEAMVFHNPKAKVTPRGEQALYQYMEAGAKLSAPHKKIAKAWAASHVDMARELQEQVDGYSAAQERAYSNWLRRAATAAADADARYVALRKDSLARGKSLIIKAAKDALPGVPEGVDETSKYNEWLRKASLAQTDADARYVAIRKDSLTRGKTLIIKAAKGALPGATSKLDNTKDYNDWLRRAHAKQVESDTRYIALRKDSLTRGKALIVKAAKDALSISDIASDDASRYARWLATTAGAKADADARYVALRKDSLARGKTLILKAARDAHPAQKDFDDSAAYAQWLRVAASRQGDADARYTALRRDSLARGKQTILQAARAALVDAVNVHGKSVGEIAEKAKEIGIRQSRVWGDFSPYDAKLKTKLTPLDLPDVSTQAGKKPSQGFFNGVSALFKDSDGKFRKLGNDMGYAHSAARGLASGFKLLWLTWGAMAPIFAGAAVSNSLRMMVQQGAAVEHEMTKIRVLSRETSEDVGQLTKKMLDLGYSSQYGPIEIAKAMKTLSLAGLEASEVYEAIRPVLNFATAGDTSIEKAADVLTGVSKAFGYTAKDYVYVADIIAGSAAKSKSSVEDMAEAFKTASTSYTKYGVSLQDISVFLSLLANVNIKGTAAGTATRNMLTDLTGRSAKAVSGLKMLGLSMSDIITRSGKMADMGTILDKLFTGLNKVGGPKGAKALRDIFSERGDKGMYEAIQQVMTVTDQLNEKNKELGKPLVTYLQTYEELKTKFSENAGFTVISAAEISLTSQDLMKSVGASFSTAMVSAFSEIQPYVAKFSMSLKEIFSSQDFRNTLAGLGVATGTVLEGITKIAGALVGLITLYATIKSAQMLWEAGSAMLITYAASISNVTASTLTLSAAWGVVKTAQFGVMAAFAAFMATPWGAILTAIGIAVASVGGAWAYYTYNAEQAKNKQGELATANTQSLIDKLREERDQLVRTNQARDEGITLQEKEMRLAALARRQENKLVSTEAKLNLEKREKDLAEFDARHKFSKGNMYRAAIVADIEQYKNEIFFRAMEDEAVTSLMYQIREESARSSTPAKPKGLGDYPIPDFKSLTAGHKDYTNFLQETNDQLSKMSSVLDRQHTNRMLILKAQHDAGLKSAADFADEEFAEIRRHEAAKSALMSQVHTEQVNKFAQEDARLRKEFGEKNIAKWLKLTDDQIEKTDDSKAKSHMLEVRAFMHAKKMNEQKRVAETETLTAEINTRMIKSSADYLVEQSKGVKTIGDDVKKLEDAISALTESEAAMGQLAGKKPEEIAAMKARSEAIKEWADNISAAVRVVEELNAERAKWEKRMDAGDFSPEVIDNYANATTLRNKASESLDRLRNNASRFAADKSAGAFKASLDEEYKKFADEFKGTLSDAVSTAIFQGGAEGGKKLRNYLQQVLIERPFKIMLESAIDTAFGKSGSSALGSLFNWSTGRSPTTSVADTFEADWQSYTLGLFTGKASGGTINPYSGYRVNESGMEMLSVGGKDYLMTGGQGGNITPANRLGATVVFSPQIHVDSRADQAQVMALVQRAVAAGNAKLVDQLQQAGAI